MGMTFADESIRDEYFKAMADYMKANGIDVEIVTSAEYDEDLLIRQLPDADGAILTSNGAMSRKVAEALPNLKFVQRYGIGLNSVDLEACAEHGVTVCYTPGYCSDEVGIHAVALGMAALRNIRLYDVKTREGVWMKGNGPYPRRPGNLTIGVVGYGKSGKIVAQAYKGGFGSRILAYDPYADAAELEKAGIEAVDLDTLIRESDMINVMCPLTKETHHMFDLEAFRKMKNDAVIVNVSRGAIIDNDALYTALTTGMISRAAIDVFEQEPLSFDNPLLKLDNITVTPHSAYYGLEAVQNADFLISHITVDFFNKKKIWRRQLANPGVLEHLTGYTVDDGPVE